MAISAESRKRLWGRSGGRCAICKESLFRKSGEHDTVLGEEAHIIARSPAGPRREFMRADVRIDDYANLILLCRRDHAIIDAQPDLWSVERLQQVKAEHEEWVRNLPPEERGPIQIRPGSGYWTQQIFPLADGSALWSLVAGAHSYQFGHAKDCTAEELDMLAAAFDSVKDWGECAFFMDSLSEEREAERALDIVLCELFQQSFVLVGRRAQMIVTGGVLPDGRWEQAEIQAWRPDQFLDAIHEQQAQPESERGSSR